MKHLGAFVSAFLLLAVAGCDVYLNRAALTGVPLYVAVGLVVFAICFIAPASFTEAVGTAKDLPAAINALRKP